MNKKGEQLMVALSPIISVHFCTCDLQSELLPLSVNKHTSYFPSDNEDMLVEENFPQK